MKSSTTTTAPAPDISTNGQARATVEDLKALIREAQDALENVGDTASTEVQVLRDRLKAVLSDGQATVKSLADSARRQAGRADDAIRANPYQSIGIAAGVGIIAGFLLSRALTGSNR